MMALIATILLGLAIALFASQNSAAVDVRLVGYMWKSVPLYMVIIISALAGVLLASIFNLLNLISSKFLLAGKESVIKQSRQTIVRMEEKIKELEKENDTLLKQRDSFVDEPTATSEVPETAVKQ